MLYQHHSQPYQELNYIRQELNRVHHITTSLEAREKELCMMLQIPMSNSVYQQLELSREEYYNLVNASKSQQGIDQILLLARLEKVIHQQAVAIQDLENMLSQERKEKQKAIQELEVELYKKRVFTESAKQTVAKEISKPAVPAKEMAKTTSSATAPKQLTTRRQRSLDAIDYTGWQTWTEVLRSVYPKSKFSSMDHSSFFTSFRSSNLGPSISGPLLPPNLFQKFITEFSKQFRSEIPADEYSDQASEQAFEKSDAILWKEILRQENINLKFDHSTEKRIRAGLVSFISANATPKHLPSGNSSRLYFIPKDLSKKFISWFQGHAKTGFREFDLKRKPSSLNDNNATATTAKAKKPKTTVSNDPVPHQILSLNVEDEEDLDLIPPQEYYRRVTIDSFR